MLRFPYLPAAVAQKKTAEPSGLFARFWRFFSHKPDPTLPVIRPSLSVKRPLVPICIRGPGPRFHSLRTLGLLDSGSTDTVIPLEIAHAIGAILVGDQGMLRWRGLEFPRQSAQVQ